MRKIVPALMLLLIVPSALASETEAWAQVAEDIVSIIDRAEESYRSGHADVARRGVVEAYFGVFEDRKMEAAMRKTIGAKHTYLVEKQFGVLRKAIGGNATMEEIHDIAEGIRSAVRRDAKVLDDADVPREVYQVTQ